MKNVVVEETPLRPFEKLLKKMCMYKGILMGTLGFIIQIITSYIPKSCEKAGDSQMMGTLAELIVAEHSYKKLMVDHLERLRRD